jgi:hypothetical protein
MDINDVIQGSVRMETQQSRVSPDHDLSVRLHPQDMNASQDTAITPGSEGGVEPSVRVQSSEVPAELPAQGRVFSPHQNPSVRLDLNGIHCAFDAGIESQVQASVRMKPAEALPGLSPESTEAAPDQDPAVTLNSEGMNDSVGAWIERVRKRSLPTKLLGGEEDEHPKGDHRQS